MNLQNCLKKLPPYLLTAIDAALIIWLTLSPNPTGDVDLQLFPGADKVVHAIMFGSLVAALALDRHRRGKTTCLSQPLLFAIASSVFGLGIEFCQRTMNLGRSFEWMDLIADSAGAFIVAGGISLLLRRVNN